jgi:RimJ/RimL family protein N-acetyltransferase
MLPIETERLIIRRMDEADCDDFLAYQRHPDVMRYQYYEPATLEIATRFLQKQATVDVDMFHDTGGRIALAVHHKADDKMIGEVGIEVVPTENQGKLGWSFHPDYHGYGYATEAGLALLEYGFSVFSLHRLTTWCDTRNTASWRLMERLGMRREGHQLQSTLQGDRWCDTYTYAILYDEWFLKKQKTDKVLV